MCSAYLPCIVQISSDQGSQIGLDLTSPRLSDRPGTSSADVFSALAHNYAFGAGSKAPAGLLGLEHAHADHGTALDLQICTHPPAHALHALG